MTADARFPAPRAAPSLSVFPLLRTSLETLLQALPSLRIYGYAATLAFASFIARG